MNIETTIVQVKRLTTKRGDSFWLCVTPDAKITASVFNTGVATQMMYSAGYAKCFSAMKEGEIQYWNTHPIRVVLTKGDTEQYWNFSSVEVKPDNAEPDKPKEINAEWWGYYAQHRAQFYLDDTNLDKLVWDTETTGVTPNDEIISIAILSANGDGANSYQLIRPTDPQKANATSAKTGITPADLEHASTFSDMWDDIHQWLNQAVWIGWNIAFDADRLAWDCERHDASPIMPLTMLDVMELFAYYAGDWDVSKQVWVKSKLTDACTRMGITLDNAHNALADATATLEVLQAIADGKPVAAMEAQP